MRFSWIVAFVSFLALAAGCATKSDLSERKFQGDEVRPAFDSYNPEIVEHVPIFGKDCTEAAEELASQKHPADCYDVFYVTMRSPEGGSHFGTEFAPQPYFGKAIVAAPVIVSSDDPTKYINKTKFSEAIKFLHPDKTVDDFELVFIDEEEYIDKSRKTRVYDQTCDSSAFDENRTCETSTWIGLAGVNGFENDFDLNDSDKFYTTLEDHLSKNRDRALVYVHGFNTTFKQSVVSAANLNADLNAKGVGTPNKLSEYPFGLPIAFSWPTLGTGPVKFELSCVKNPSCLRYLRSQVRAHRAANQLAELLLGLIERTSVTEVNLIAHSMGNRVLLDALEIISKRNQIHTTRPVALRIINAAADVAYDDYTRKTSAFTSHIASNGVQLNPEINIYASESDHALYFSVNSQRAKRKKKYELIDKPIPEFPDAAVRAEISLLRQELESTKLDIDEFMSEGRCRVGKQWPCQPYVFPDSRAFTIDATGFNTDRLNHGYFENSPMILADMGCGLAGEKPQDGLRALEAATFNQRRSRKEKTYWIFEPNENGSDSCKTSGRKILYEVREKSAADVQLKTITVYFDLLKANLSAEAYSTLEAFAADVLSSEFNKVVVVGYTDTSGAEQLNNTLARRRAEAVKAALVQLGFIPDQIWIRALGEKDLAVETGDGVREARNRRATIVIE